MSTGDTLGDILARAHALRLSVGLLPATFDIDEAVDLRHLRAALLGRHDLPATASALRALDRGLAPAHAPADARRRLGRRLGAFSMLATSPDPTSIAHARARPARPGRACWAAGCWPG